MGSKRSSKLLGFNFKLPDFLRIYGGSKNSQNTDRDYSHLEVVDGYELDVQQDGGPWGGHPILNGKVNRFY